MTETHATVLHFVQTTAPGNCIGEPSQMWVAATTRDAAVEAVRRMVPGDYLARLVMSHEVPSGAIDLKLRPGEVRKYEEP